MPGSLNIRYIAHEDIDPGKWDQCIDIAENGLVYGYSFYLDHMADNWDGLVLGDYEAVMPLTWKKKWGIYYLTQPFLTAQLGVFGKNLGSSTLEQFLLAIPVKFKYWDIYLNHGNIFPNQKYKLYERKNFLLDLNKSYSLMHEEYNENTRRNVKKAKQAGLITKKDFSVDKVIDLAQKQMQGSSSETRGYIRRFRELYQLLYSKKMALTYGVEKDGALLATAVFFLSHQRAYYILVGNNSDGKTIGASHALIDAFIQDNAGKNIWLDFEGSDIPNLALFYSSFGAKQENYAAIKLNRLPFYLRWMKK